MATTIISRIQILVGRFGTVMKASNKQEWLKAQSWLEAAERQLIQLKILPVDEAAANEFERLRQIKSLRKIGLAQTDDRLHRPRSKGHPCHAQRQRLQADPEPPNRELGQLRPKANSMSIIPYRFLVRVMYACPFVADMPRDDDSLIQLPDSARIEPFSEIDAAPRRFCRSTAWLE